MHEAIKEVRVEDGREDAYAKLRRTEILKYARLHKLPIEEFNESVPGRDLQDRLRARRIPVQPMSPPIGSLAPTVIDASTAHSHTPEAIARDQAEQYRDFQKAEAQPEKPVAEMSMNEMRKECRRLGIKMDRRDNMTTLREKLKAHEHNAPAVG